MKAIPLAAFFLIGFPAIAHCVVAPTIWARQLGTSTLDQSFGVTVDGSGNVYIAGSSYGDLGGQHQGDSDAFLAKYDPFGNAQWVRQAGTPLLDAIYGVAADSLGSIFVSGATSGNLNGFLGGFYDAFVGKYDAQGNLKWIQQVGTASDDFSFGVSADGLGNVYIAGETLGNFEGTNQGESDGFLAKYDSNGSLVWKRQFGTTAIDRGRGVTADALGNVFVVGSTLGDLAGSNPTGRSEAFIAKYDADGDFAWLRQLGTNRADVGNAASVDGLGNVYVTGYTQLSQLPVPGQDDAILRKYDASGDLIWTRQIGTGATDRSYSVIADQLGNAFITGSTNGDLAASNLGNYDAFIAKYDAAGDLRWVRQLGTNQLDESSAITNDGMGSIYISGWTGGGFNGQLPAGGLDALLVEIEDVPEPSAILLAIVALLGLRRPLGRSVNEQAME